MNHSAATEDGKPARQSSKMKIILFVSIIVTLLLLLAIGLGVYFGLDAVDKGPCLTSECLASASELSNYIDRSEDPCNDFYQFACGTYLEQNKKYGYKSVRDDIYSKIDEDIMKMLEVPPNYDDKHSTKLVKAFFDSCMNESLLENVNLRRIKLFLHQAGGWPVLEDGWSESGFDWTKTTVKLRNLGAQYDIFFYFSLQRQEEEGAKPNIKITNINFPPVENRKLLHDLMVDISVMMGARKIIAERDFNQVLNFRQKIVEAMNFTSEDSTYTPRTVREIRLMYPSITQEFLSQIFHPQEVTQDDVVTLADPYLLPRVLNVINNASKRVVANYMMFINVKRLIDLLPARFREKHSQYMNIAQGFLQETRLEVCYEYVKQSSNPILVEPYFKKYYTDDMKRSVRGILRDIKDQYKEIVDEISWLDSDAKKLVKEKIAGSEDFITMDEYSFNKRGEEFYDDVRVNESDPLESFLKLNAARINFDFSAPFEPLMNIPYDPKRNKFVLEPTDTQGIFFEKDRPQYLNFGALGSSLAYQLSGIIFEGKNYDYYGNLRQWSSSDSLIAYDDRLSCLASQYRNIYIPEIQGYPNVLETKKTDMAFLLADHVAYKAYEAWLDENGKEMKLPGLPYTPKQLFWISSAVTKCGIEPVESLKRQMNSKGIPPPRMSVNGPLRNLDEFSTDFNCPSESRMNPLIKCNI